MANKTGEPQDFELGLPGVEIKITQGKVRGRLSALIEIEVGGQRLTLEAKPTPEDFDGELVVNVVKVAVVESNTEEITQKVLEFVDSPRAQAILAANGIHKI